MNDQVILDICALLPKMSLNHLLSWTTAQIQNNLTNVHNDIYSNYILGSALPNNGMVTRAKIDFKQSSSWTASIIQKRFSNVPKALYFNCNGVDRTLKVTHTKGRLFDQTVILFNCVPDQNGKFSYTNFIPEGANYFLKSSFFTTLGDLHWVLLFHYARA